MSNLSNETINTLLNSSEGRRAIAAQSKEFFSSYYLGLEIPECQEKWYSFLNRKRHHQEAPRDHGKTMVFGYSYPLWNLCNRENVRVLLASKTGGPTGISTKLMDAISDELKTNERIIEDYGKLITRERGPALFVKRTKRSKDPSLESVGVGGAITGGHYDIIICDDIIDESNTRTPNMRKIVRDWFTGTLMELLEPHSQILVTGTRKHWDDLYQFLIENKMWTHNIDVAIKKYPESYEYVTDNETGQIIDVIIHGDSEVLWPEKWDIKTLLMNRADIGSIMFNREKQNDPSGMQGKILSAKWIKYFEHHELPDDLQIYQGIDLAISEEDVKSGDYIAIVTCAFSPSLQRIFVIDMWRGHKTFPEQVKMIETYADMYAPDRITIENNQYQKAMVQAQHARNMHKVVGMPTTKDKVSRIIAMSPHLEIGKIRFADDLAYWDDFLDEYTQFPDGANDDMLDALEICIKPIVGGGEVHLGTFMSNKNYAQVTESEWYS